MAAPGGVYLYWRAEIQHIRESVKKRLLENFNESDLFCLRLATKDAARLRWKDAEEFEYQGQWYDVVKSAVGADSLYYWCLHDQKETEFRQKLRQTVAFILQHDASHRQSQTQLLAFYKTLFCHSGDLPCLSAYAALHTDQPNHWVRLMKSLCCKAPPAPPPQRA